MEEIIIKLLGKPDKSIDIKEIFLVKRIELRDKLDQIRLDLQHKDKEYKGLVMEKGDTFPIPKINDIMSIEKIYLKYSQEFQLKLYIKGKIDLENEKPEFDKVNKIYSFEYLYIFKTLSELSKTTVSSINSSIFKIVDMNYTNGNNKPKIKDISNSKIYEIKLNKEQIKSFKQVDFLWLYYYEIIEDNILLNTLTTLEVLNEEKLIRFLDNYFFVEKITLFEVIDIDIDNDIITLINPLEKLYELKNIQHLIKDYNINFCSLIIISNYVIKEGNKIEIKEDSFIYKFNEQSYYLENIITNSYSVIKLISLDYEKDNNTYDCISYESENEKTKLISNKIEYITISSLVSKKYDYYPFQLTLLNSKKEDVVPITFTIYLYQSLMNKINVFLNTNSPKTYFYEFLFYNLSDNLGKIKKRITISNDNKYDIDISDNFGSFNRKRISIMNIPYQENEILEEELNTNSIQICELIRGNIHKIIGIYNINFFGINREQPCEYFDEFYQNFGDIYDMIINYSLKNSEIIQNTLINKTKSFSFQKIKQLDKIDLTEVNYFEKEMTLSQFKTRVGLIICYYIDDYMDDEENLNKIIIEVFYMFNQINKENLGYYDIIRILIFILDEKIVNNSLSTVQLKLVSKLNSNSPYALAYNFNIEQINCLNEFSALFQAYLELDSYHAYNYIHNTITYNFSLELLFMIKYQLLSTYDKFFYVKRNKGNEFAYLESKTKITVINEYESFGENFKEKDIIKDPKKVNDYAMPLSFHFMHENGGHNKYDLKNEYFNPSCIYFRGLKIEIEARYHQGILIGESGRMIENFICDDKEIIQHLSTKFIFGEFFKKEYFNKKDFKNFISHIKQKLQANKDKKEENYIIQTSSQNKKNYSNNRKFEELNEEPRFVQIGDMVLDVKKIKRNALITEEEKKESFKNYLLAKQKKYRDLKKIRNENNKKEHEY